MAQILINVSEIWAWVLFAFCLGTGFKDFINWGRELLT